MRFAVILNKHPEFVDNVIIANAAQKEELEAALNATLMDATPLDMQIGDYFNGRAWTRNVNGEQVELPVGDNPVVDEVLAILGGEIDVGLDE